MSQTPSSHEANPDQKIEAIVSAVQAPAASPETLQPPTKMIIIPGDIYPAIAGAKSGKPMGYFVRSEGCTDATPIKPESIEGMLGNLLGPEAADFIAGIQSPEAMLIQAENLKAKLEDPAMQQRIRKLHAEQAKLKTDLE